MGTLVIIFAVLFGLALAIDTRPTSLYDFATPLIHGAIVGCAGLALVITLVVWAAQTWIPAIHITIGN